MFQAPEGLGYDGSVVGDYAMPRTGEYDLTIPRVVSLTLRNVPPTVRVGEKRYAGMNGLLQYDSGESVSTPGRVDIFSSDRSILRTGNDGNIYVEGVSPGNATVGCRYWGVTSPEVAVQVIP